MIVKLFIPIDVTAQVLLTVWLNTTCGIRGIWAKSDLWGWYRNTFEFLSSVSWNMTFGFPDIQSQINHGPWCHIRYIPRLLICVVRRRLILSMAFRITSLTPLPVKYPWGIWVKWSDTKPTWSRHTKYFTECTFMMFCMASSSFGYSI